MSEELLDTTVENGQKQNLRLGFKVIADKPVQGAELGVHLPPGLELNPAERPSNCEHFKVDPVREYRDEYLFCSFTGTFEPGKHYRLDTGLNVTATPELWRDSLYVTWTPGGKPIYKPEQGGVKGTAAALKVAPSEPFKDWGFWGREVAVGNPANQVDFTVNGATGSGPAGGQALLNPGWQIKARDRSPSRPSKPTWWRPSSCCRPASPSPAAARAPKDAGWRAAPAARSRASSRSSRGSSRAPTTASTGTRPTAAPASPRWSTSTVTSATTRPRSPSPSPRPRNAAQPDGLGLGLPEPVRLGDAHG
ncbi:hypothetical protein SF23_05195, partial [Streptomyces sp. MBRL 10]